MDLSKRRLQIGGSILLPLFFVSPLFADAPVVDLMAKPEPKNEAYVSAPLNVEQRLQILERKMDNDALIDLYQRMEALQIEVQQLRGYQEEQAYSVEGVKQRQRDLYIDLDQRISALQQSVKKLSIPAAAPETVLLSVPVTLPAVIPDLSTEPAVADSTDSSVVATESADSTEVDNSGVDISAEVDALDVAVVTVDVVATEADVNVADPQPISTADTAIEGAAVVAAPVPVLDSTPASVPAAEFIIAPTPINPLQEQSDYQKALDLLMNGSYDEAVTAFNAFLQNYPKGEYRMNAQYWLGEAYYVGRHFDQSVESFSQVIADKTARKRPDAMLKSGYSFYEQKRWAECRDMLQQLVAEYPQSTAAGLAEQRLQMLRAANL